MAVDKPKAPDLVLAEDDFEFEPFVFTVRGKRYQLPPVGELPLESALVIGAAQDDPAAAIEAMVSTGDAALRDVVMGLPSRAALKLFTAWTDFSEVDSGESVPSES